MKGPASKGAKGIRGRWGPPVRNAHGKFELHFIHMTEESEEEAEEEEFPAEQGSNLRRERGQVEAETHNTSVAEPSAVVNRVAQRASAAELQKLKMVRQSSIRKSSQRVYNHAMGLWEEYIHCLPKECEPGTMMELLRDNEEKAVRLSLFAVWLKEVKGRFTEDVKKTFTALKATWEIDGASVGTLAAFNDAGTERTVKGCQRSKAEIRTKAEAAVAKPELLGLCREMVEASRVLFWASQAGWGTSKEVDSRIRHLAIALGFEHGLRTSNLVTADKAEEDNAIREQDVMVHVRAQISGKEEVVTGMSAFHDWYDQQEWDKSVSPFIRNRACVVDIAVRVVNDKTNTGAKGIGVWKGLDRTTAASTQLLEDFTDFMYCGQTPPGECLFTRVAATKVGKKTTVRRFRRSDLAKAIKDTAVYCDLPAERFSTKSMRIGFTTDTTAAGLPEALQKAHGGWTEKSRVARAHYNKPVSFCGSSAMPAGGTTLAQLRACVARLPSSGLSGAERNDKNEGSGGVNSEEEG